MDRSIKANSFTALFDSFTKEERKAFELFLKSPYFNSSSIASRLFEVHVTQEKGNISYEGIWALLFPDKPFADNQLRKHYSDLHLLARKFLMVEELGNSAMTSSLLLLKRFRRTVLPAKLRRELELAEKELPHDVYAFADVESYFYAAQLADYGYYLDAAERGPVASLGKAISSLDAAYLLSKLKLLCEINSLRSVFQYESDFLLESEIVGLATAAPFSEYLLVGVYLRIFQLFRRHQNVPFGRGSEDRELLEKYDELARLLEDNYAKIAFDELQTIQNFQQNLCIQRIALADPNFEERLDVLYGFRLRNGSIFVNGWLRVEDYKNRTSLLLKLGRFAQALDFVQAYSERVLPEFRKSALHFNLGNYYYHVGDFGRMRKELMVIPHLDTFYLLDSKSLMIKAFFWEHDVESLKLQLDSLKVYLRRNSKLPPDRIARHANRFRFFEKLYRILEKGDFKKGRLEKLRGEIAACDGMLDQQFMLDLLARW